MMQLTRYKASFKKECKALIAHSNGEPNILEMIEKQGKAVSLVAVEQGKVIGLAAVWSNRVHPFCYYLRLYIDPFLDFTRIGSRMLEEVEKEKLESLPFQITAKEEELKLMSLLESAGFAEVRRTYMPMVEVRKDHIERIEKNPEFEWLDFKQAEREELIKEGLASLVKQNYEETHTVNPAAHMPMEEWDHMIWNGDVWREGSYLLVCRTSKEVKAYSFLHKTENTRMAEWGWCGAAEPSLIKWIPSLVAAQFRFAAFKGIQYLQGEFDSTSPYAMEVMNAFSLPKKNTLITYRQRD
ncbi:hypothetical protein [Bacillus sp. 1P06AnD]|uniref:hypothetical protein n=1 Tax=Bacillus sp. 1P06AnD TaxID=3132208 RepID=UPI00399FFE80